MNIQDIGTIDYGRVSVRMLFDAEAEISAFISPTLDGEGGVWFNVVDDKTDKLLLAGTNDDDQGAIDQILEFLDGYERDSEGKPHCAQSLPSRRHGCEDAKGNLLDWVRSFASEMDSGLERFGGWVCENPITFFKGVLLIPFFIVGLCIWITLIASGFAMVADWWGL